MAARNRRGRAGVLEAIFAVSWKPWALRRTKEGLHRAIRGREVCLVPIALRMDGAHLVPHSIVLALLSVVLVEVHDVDSGLGVLLLLLLCDAVAGQHALPFLREPLDIVSERRGPKPPWRGKG